MNFTVVQISALISFNTIKVIVKLWNITISVTYIGHKCLIITFEGSLLKQKWLYYWPISVSVLAPKIKYRSGSIVNPILLTCTSKCEPLLYRFLFSRLNSVTSAFVVTVWESTQLFTLGSHKHKSLGLAGRLRKTTAHRQYTEWLFHQSSWN